MMPSTDDLERMFVEVDEESERGKAVGCPSYDDLLEENIYLRSEMTRFYEQGAVTPKALIVKSPRTSDCNLRLKELDDELSNEKYQCKRLNNSFESLKVEFGHLQSHCFEQAAAAKIAAQKLEEVEYELHMANAELLQILPLRMKLTESNKKLEVLRGENLSLANEMDALKLERDQISAQFGLSRRCYEDMQKSFNTLCRQSEILKAEKSDLREQMTILERIMNDKTLAVKSLELHIKKLDEMVIILKADCAHWERKSVSASKELVRLSSSNQSQMISQHAELKDKNSALKSKLKLREEAIKSILKQSLTLRNSSPSRMKRSRCVSLRACISPHKRGSRSLSVTDKTSCSPASLSPLKEKGRAIPIEISTAAIKEMGVEITCDSIDDQEINDFNEKDDGSDRNCICGGFSFLRRRKSIRK